MGDAHGRRHHLIEQRHARMRHEELVVEGVQRRMQILLDAGEVEFSVFGSGMITVNEYRPDGDQKKKSDVPTGQRGLPVQRVAAVFGGGRVAERTTGRSASSASVVILRMLTNSNSSTIAGVENRITRCVPGVTKCKPQTPAPSGLRDLSANPTITYTESMVYGQALVQFAQ